MPGKPSLELAVEVTAADGTHYRWDSSSRPGSVPQGLTFNTKQGTGFAEASVTLSRRVDRDYIDLNLYDSVVIAGADGSVAYEGMVGALPRSMQQTHTVTPQLAGWMVAAQFRKFQEVYVDRSFSGWGQAPLNERIRQTATLSRDFDASYSWQVDNQALVCNLPNQALGPLCEAIAWYTAPPPVRIAKIMYQGGAPNFPAGYAPGIGVSQNDSTTSSESYLAVLNGAMQARVFTNQWRYAFVDVFSNGTTATPVAGSQAYYSQLAVYGNHGLTTHPIAGEPDGVYASDVITDIIRRFVPELNTAGVQPTTYPIGHLAYADRISPYDALLDVNKYHLWQLNVWENRTVYYEPYDLSDYDWEVRLDQPGVTVDLQGDSTQTLSNGIAVTFTNVDTGLTDVVDPTTNPSDLTDPAVDNPATVHGVQSWMEVQLSFPATAADAVQFGRIALADNNQPKAPGTITVQGHIRDRAGHWQPVWKVRAGDRVAITNHPDDRPRLVVETSYSHDSKTAQIGTDNTLQQVPALFDRISTALAANNVA